MSPSKKVLVIDDAEDHLLICKLVLEHWDYEVLPLRGIASLEELFEVVFSYSRDLIFTEQDMPGLDGEQIVRMLKRVPQFKHIPAI
jgi:CheY-like chemotaxis protein